MLKPIFRMFTCALAETAPQGCRRWCSAHMHTE